MAPNENTLSKEYVRKNTLESPAVKLRKPTKTISGVAPLTVVLPERPCDHGTCTFCPTMQGVPQSYTPLSPAVMRARMLNYRPTKQVEARLKAFQKMGHPTDKIEIIVLGGTFLQYPKVFKYEFIKACFDALNGVPSKDLEEAKRINETAEHRCVALCIETRPDNCSEEEIREMLSYGCTRIELGIQMPDDHIYELVNRGHTVADVVQATRRLKNANLKVFYHIMPGLPGSNPKKDMEMFNMIFDDERFRPDGLKLYPCQVIKDSQLEQDFYEGKYKPYTEDETREILIKMVEKVPAYCRVMRMMREIPPVYIVAGLKRIDLRTEVEKGVDKNKIEEIRMREIGFRKTNDYGVEIKVIEYNACGGREFFIQAVNKENILFGLCRLRIREEKGFVYGAIRELHVYGKAEKIGIKPDDPVISQHRGLGKKLVEKAEEIAKSNGVRELDIISGVGVRKYFYKIGYKLKSPYVSKTL